VFRRGGGGSRRPGQCRLDFTYRAPVSGNTNASTHDERARAGGPGSGRSGATALTVAAVCCSHWCRRRACEPGASILETVSILTEIDLRHACSYQEVEDGNARTGCRRPPALPAARGDLPGRLRPAWMAWMGQLDSVPRPAERSSSTHRVLGDALTQAERSGLGRAPLGQHGGGAHILKFVALRDCVAELVPTPSSFIQLPLPLKLWCD
jgi:hypothetical protein